MLSMPYNVAPVYIELLAPTWIRPRTSTNTLSTWHRLLHIGGDNEHDTYMSWYSKKMHGSLLRIIYEMKFMSMMVMVNDTNAWEDVREKTRKWTVNPRKCIFVYASEQWEWGNQSTNNGGNSRRCVNHRRNVVQSTGVVRESGSHFSCVLYIWRPT